MSATSPRYVSNKQLELCMQRRMFLLSLALSAALAVTSWTGTAIAQSGSATVFAAASLKNALDDIATKWRAESGKQVTISYAASSTLAKQIENGAPADMFISADLDWMDYLDQRKLIAPGSRRNL